MTLALLLVPTAILVCAVVAHERALWLRRKRASEDLRRRFPTIHGGPRL